MKGASQTGQRILLLVLLLLVALLLAVGCGPRVHGPGTPTPSVTVPLPTPTFSSPTATPSSLPPTTPQSPPSFCPLSPSSLNFPGFATRNPDPQNLTLSNCGGPGNWTAKASTSGGGSWLRVHPTRGFLDANALQTLSVTVNSANLPIEMYNGQIVFTFGPSTATVQVSLGLALLTVTPIQLTFTVGAPSPPPLTLFNQSQETFTWTATVSTTNGGSWLATNLSSGSLGPGQNVQVTVSVTSAGLPPGTYTGQIVIAVGSNGNTLTIPVTLNVQPAPTPSPTLNTGFSVATDIVGEFECYGD